MVDLVEHKPFLLRGSNLLGLFVGMVAIAGTVFLLYEPQRVTTFLGEAGFLSSDTAVDLRLSPDTISVEKGESFEVDVMLTPGRFATEEIGYVLLFDPERMQIEEIDPSAWTFSFGGTGDNVRIDNAKGELQIQQKERYEGAEELMVNTIVFSATQSIGAADIVFDTTKQATYVFHDEDSGNVLRDATGSTVEILLSKP